MDTPLEPVTNTTTNVISLEEFRKTRIVPDTDMGMIYFEMQITGCVPDFDGLQELVQDLEYDNLIVQSYTIINEQQPSFLSRFLTKARACWYVIRS